MEPRICPYLGLNDDPNTNKSFPYEGNICYRAKKPTTVALSHQRGYCLRDEHTVCPGYINGWVNGFPDSLKAYPPTYKRVLQNKWGWPTLAVVLLISVYLIFSQQINTMGNNLGRSVASRFAGPTSTAAGLFTSIPTSTHITPTRTTNIPQTAVSTSASLFTSAPTPTLIPTTTETTNKITKEPMYKVEVITTALNIRSEPIYKVSGINIVDTLTKGEIIEVYEEQKGWLLTERGWIFKYYTKVVK